MKLHHFEQLSSIMNSFVIKLSNIDILTEYDEDV